MKRTGTRDWTWIAPRASAVAGLVVWAVLYGLAWDSLPTLMAFGPLVLVPAALALLREEDRRGAVSWSYRALVGAQPAAALLTLAPGLASLAWLAFGLLCALHASLRLIRRGFGPAEELAIDAALLFLPVGAAWLVAARVGLEPMGFAEPIVTLTAIHFHVAAFALLVVAGVAGRVLHASRLYSAVVAALVGGSPLLAAGITLGGALERVAAILLAAGVLGLAGLAVAQASRWPALAVALAASVVSMPLAVLYALGNGPDVAGMARTHGALNAYVLAFGALAALHLHTRSEGYGSRAARAGMPLSALASRGRTGPDFFEREGHVERRSREPKGLVDDLAEYARDGFEPTRVRPEIRAFYERTVEHGLLVTPHWRRGFRAGGRLYARYAKRVGQMVLPLSSTRGERVRSRIVALRRDGRENVRAWVRTYEATGEPVYVAAYATHKEAGETYMNIAFPFPRWNLTSVLRMEELGQGGVLLTTKPFGGARRGDQGVHVVVRGRAWRLPMDETIRVWTVDMPDQPVPVTVEGASVTARHEIRLFGILFLRMDYEIWPSPSDASAPPSAPPPG